MKLGKLGSSIQTVIQPLDQVGATDSAKALSLLCSLFNDLNDVEAEALIEKSKAIEASGGQGPTVDQVISVLINTLDLMQSVGASAPKKNALKGAIDCLQKAERGMSFASFCNQIKASLLIDVVQFYLESLETTLGTPNFEAAYAALEGDARVTGPKLAEITSRFVSRTGRTAPRRQMLQRIYARHASLVDLARKNEWQRGRSAA